MVIAFSFQAKDGFSFKDDSFYTLEIVECPPLTAPLKYTVDQENGLQWWPEKLDLIQFLSP